MTPTYDPTPREDKREDDRWIVRLAGIERAAFDAGARAMQDRICAGIARWWSAAPAGQRHPGHPHHLDAKARAVRVEDLEGRP